jgi:hypothetical protein
MKDQYLQKIDNPDLTQFLKEMRDALGRTESRISELEGEVRDLQSKLNSSPQNTSFHHLSPADSTPITQTDTHTPIPLEPPVLPSQGEMRYALYMDNSEGFSISGLMYEKGPETVYEIALISPHTATYRIANQRDAQSYALTDPGYYLRTACDYENSPTSGRAIETVASGSLELMGSIWKITQRAKIKFV